MNKLTTLSNDDGNLRSAALGAHNRVLDVWGKKASPGANNILAKLEPGSVEAYALDHAIRYIWERQRNGNELTQCKLNIEITKKLRNIVLEVLDENLAALTTECTYSIPDPEIAEQREKEKRNKSVEEMKERETRQEQLKKEKAEREKRIHDQTQTNKEEKALQVDESKKIKNIARSAEDKKVSKKSKSKSLKVESGEKRKTRSKSPRKSHTEDLSNTKKIEGKEKRKSKTEKSEKEKKSSDKEKKTSDKEKKKRITRLHTKKAYTFETSDSTEDLQTSQSTTIKLPASEKREKNDQSKEEKRMQIQNSRNRRRQFASLPLHGRRPKLLHGGGVETEDPIPIIEIKQYLVDLNEIKQKLENKLAKQISDEEINVNTIQNDNPFLDFYHLSVKGPRPANEDEYSVIEHVNELFGLSDDVLGDKYSYFGVFDGHSGKYTSLVTRSQLQANLFSHPSFPDDSAFHHAFVTTDKRVNEAQRRENFCCGTTALCVCVKNNNDMFIGNVGDGRGFLCRAGEPFEIASPHNLNNEEEKDRIKALGGAVVWFGTWRVNGILAVSRSIGDNNLRDLVIADPDITRFSITKDDEFLVLASDGLWDGIDGKEMIEIVKKTVAEKGREHVCKVLCDTGIEKNTKDNVTVVVCFFNHK